MAKAFGDDKDEENDEKKGACGGGHSKNPKDKQGGDEDIREEAQEAEHLFFSFIRSEIHRNGLTEPSEVVPHEIDIESIPNDRLLSWTRAAGRELRQLADTFSQSKEREFVRRRATELNLSSLDFEHFLELLQELFQGEGITRERILVLFFFCADVAIEALKKGLSTKYFDLIQWSLKYIVTYVASWVHNNGGWGVVLRSSLNIAYQVTACCAFVAVVAACVVYIRRNL